MADRPPLDQRFVNPYTFVGLPDPTAMQRRRPAGHDRLPPDRLSGRLLVTWRAKAPILYRRPAPNGSWSAWQHEGRYGLPGSSIKGAVRSVHETLFGGCMRVVDLDAVAVHREPATINRGVLAVVRDHDPTSDRLTVELCDDHRWIRHDVLVQVLGGPDRIRTGARLSIRSRPDRTRLERDEHLSAAGISADGDWVLHVTDVAARHRKRPVWFVAGHLSGETRIIGDDKLQDYRREAAGSDDERRGLEGDVAVRRGKTLGWRQPVRRDLPPGTVIWLRRDDDRIARATIWRRSGKHPVRERLDRAWWPCGAEVEREEENKEVHRHSDELCPTCRLFGSAGDEAPHNGAERGADRRAINYRSHIRFGPALADDVTPRRLDLAPLGTPNISSGQFYLQPPRDKQVTRAEREVPLARWGSRADRPEPRPIRGRKYYWHGVNDRHDKRPHHSDEMTASVEVLPKRTELSATICFSGLTPIELGQLIAAIDPARVLTDRRPPGHDHSDPGPVLTRLGGGRPFGFGSVEVTSIEVADLHTASSRYTGGPDPVLDVDELVRAAVEATPGPIRAVWPQAAAALSHRWVPAESIWYPPGAPWTQKGTQEFDEAFRFFGLTDGRYYPNRDNHPLVCLPRPEKPDQGLPIVQDNKRRGGGGRGGGRGGQGGGRGRGGGGRGGYQGGGGGRGRNRRRRGGRR
ncbi:MAG: hypothetical protein D6683_16650 [Actinomyces sp.]|nr:MAG: hypothetical protein D6683_16650 [Actinomyces sp.]